MSKHEKWETFMLKKFAVTAIGTLTALLGLHTDAHALCTGWVPNLCCEGKCWGADLTFFAGNITGETKEIVEQRLQVGRTACSWSLFS